MMKSTLFFGLIFTLLVSVSAKVGRPGPHAVVYKTKGDYSKYVPVNLSDDKSRIISYPAPQDVYTAGKLALPTVLPHGFWLDNRGIGPNSCFVKITYEEYAKMAQAPSPDELYKLIIDKEPFTEMYDLGLRYTLKDEEIREIVKKHKLKEYKKFL
jgi:hypothetical protein